MVKLPGLPRQGDNGPDAQLAPSPSMSSSSASLLLCDTDLEEQERPTTLSSSSSSSSSRRCLDSLYEARRELAPSTRRRRATAFCQSLSLAAALGLVWVQLWHALRRRDGSSPSMTRAGASPSLRDVVRFEEDEVFASEDQREITFVTLETRGPPLLAAKDFGFEEKFHTKVVNLGVDKKWRDFNTKVSLFAEYLEHRMEMLGAISPDEVADQLIVLVDGDDLVYGGCSEESFRDAYHRVTAQSGASIVFSAEVVCGEQDCDRVPKIPQWAEDLAEGRDLEGGFWKGYATGCNGTWTTIKDAQGVPCASKRNCGIWAPCSEPPAVKFLNSGFIMGGLVEMREMLEWCVQRYKRYSVWGDQSVFAEYWMEHRHRIALDYLGELSFSLSDMAMSILKGSIDAHGRPTIINEAFSRTQCFVHGNGRGKPTLQRLVSELTNKTWAQFRGF